MRTPGLHQNATHLRLAWSVLAYASVDATDLWDVVIVGGGPAGLSAALLLGRCRRRVLVLDEGRPRNRMSHAAHGVFTRDGENPAELLRIACEQLVRYGVELRRSRVTRVERVARQSFELRTNDGARYWSRKLLLATGISDSLPDIPDIESVYGRSAFHCPYCDGWEVRDQRLVALGHGASGVEYALALTTWSRDVVLCTNGHRRLASGERAKLRAHGIHWYEERVASLQHANGQLRGLSFESGKALRCDALFFHAATRQRCELARELGCSFTREGSVKTGPLASSGRGLYVAGDAAREVHLISVAAAEGVKAAFAINKELREEQSQALLAPLHARDQAHLTNQ